MKTLLLAIMLFLSGCYQVSVNVKTAQTFDASFNVEDKNETIVYPKDGKNIDSFMGKYVKNPYGYKNFCRKYVKKSRDKTLDEYDVRAFYTFCNYDVLCDYASRKNSRYYSDHQFFDGYCKVNYIDWRLSEELHPATEEQYHEIQKEIGTYNGKNGLDVAFKAFKWLKKNFVYVSDEEQFPFAPNDIYDVWYVNASKQTYGDCEDWTLKLIWLLEDVALFPKDKLYMIGAFAYTGEGHELPNYKDKHGVLWQMDNMLDEPVPAFYMYRGVGAKSDSVHGMGEIMRMDKVGLWFEFKPENLIKPCDNRK